jgi:hypothetical protein
MVVRIHRGQLMRFLLVLSLAAWPAILSSQQPTSPSGYAILTGVAVDSLRGGYLKGAIVAVSGTTRSGMTDSVGRFRVDSVPPGSRYLELMHPLLDSIALAVRSPVRDIKASDTTAFILAVPSALTIVETKCTPSERDRGEGALLGTVTDADTEAPSTGATVTVEWTEYQLARRSMSKIPQRRIGAVRPDGSYRVCGIPTDLATGVLAYRGADSTGLIAASFERRLAVVSFHLPAQAANATVSAATSLDSTAAKPARGAATLAGKVLDPSGTPLAGARVAVEADEAAAVTDNQGAFHLSGLRAGTRTLNVRRIGFASVDMPVDVSGTSTRSVTVTMSRYVAILDAVRVSAIRDLGLQRVGFTDRKNSRSGKFFSPDEIQTRNPQRLINLLETAPMLRPAANATGHRYVTGRHNGCVSYFVDGLRWYTASSNDPDTTPDAFLSGAELGAVEVYDDMSPPAEFMQYSNRGEPCAVVVIWTKQKLSR